MKKLPLTLLSALAIASAVHAQTTVSSDPVGFVSVTAPANSDTPMSLPLNRPNVLQTTVASVSNNVITLNSTLTSNQFVYSSPSQTNHYYLSVKSTVSPTSTVLGKWYEITANTASAVTVDPSSPSNVQTQGLVAGDTVEIIPFWTLNTLFPNGQNISLSVSADSPTDIIYQLPQNVAGVNLASAKSSIYSNDSNYFSSAGWYDANSFSPVGDDPLAPDTYFVVHNAGASQTMTLTGSVPMSSKNTNIVRLQASKAQDNFLVNPFPTPISLPETNLFESGAFAVSPNADSPTDILYIFSGTETGFNAQPSAAYIYSNDSNYFAVAGWYDANSFAGPFTSSSKLIPVGSGIIVRKGTSGSVADLSWTAPKPY